MEPIWSEEAEKSVLGACLISPEAVAACAAALKPEMFHLPKHRRIFGAVLRLFAQDKPVDMTTVAEELGTALKACGGHSYLAELGMFVPAPSQAEAYAAIIRDKWVRRKLLEAGKKLQELAVSQEETAAVLDKAGAMILGIGSDGMKGAVHVGDIAFRHWDELYKTRETGTCGVPTGFSDLDAAIGGLRKSDLIVLAGRPSMGKTALGLQIAYQVAASGRTTVVFSLEMSAEQLAERLICAEAGLDSQAVRVRRLSERQWDRGWKAASRVAGAELWIDDSPTVSTTEIMARARRLKAEKGLELVVVDYLQLLGDAKEPGATRSEQIAAMTRRLKVMARDLEVPVLCLSQLNRQSEQRADKRPELADLRESGAIEQDADMVMMLHRPDFYDPKDSPGICEVWVKKNRTGPTGLVRLRFDKNFCRFQSLSAREEDEAA